MKMRMHIAIVAAVLTLWSAPVALAEGPASVSGLAARLTPAVVNISTSHSIEDMGLPFPQGPEGTPFDDMLEELNPNQDLGPDAMGEARSLGSGFLISADGLIVTNNHVVTGATEILVMLSDGTRFDATLVGADDKADLAVLKVDPGERRLPFVEFGDSDLALVGDWVMAIGNPFGLGGSVSMGIVSARNRDINSGPYDDFIQTDAAINQGSSGGPLFDMSGKVIGINTAIMAAGGSSLGIGFSVPVNLARPVLTQLSEFGETRRGWLGLELEEVGDEVAATRGGDTKGALVVNVTPTSPAEGLFLPGDIVTSFNGRAIVRMRDLPRMVAETAVGEKAQVIVSRNGEQIVLDVTLGRLEEGEKIIAAQREANRPPPQPTDPLPTPAPPDLPTLLGIEAGAITDETRDQFVLAEDIDGVLVTGVIKGTDAEQQGILAGFVITEVNGQPISTEAELLAKVETAIAAGRPSIVLRYVNPAGSERSVAVKLIR